MLDKVQDIIEYAEDKGIPITKGSLSEVVEQLFLAHLITFLIEWFFKLGIAFMICVTAFHIAR